MAFMKKLNLIINQKEDSPSRETSILRNVYRLIIGLIKFYLAIEVIIFLIFLIDIVFNDTNQAIVDRRPFFFSIPLVIGILHSVFNRAIDKSTINLSEEFKLSKLMLAIPSVIAMLNFITLRGDLIFDFIFSIFLGLVFLVIQKVLVFYFDVEVVVSYLLVIIAILVFFGDSNYIVSFETPMWDIIKKPLTLRNILTFSLPLALTAMGAAYNERAGVINIGLEGFLIMSAFSAIYFAIRFDSPWMGLLGAVFMGALFGLLHAFLTITMKAEQIVTGVAINLFAAGTAALLTALIWTPGKSDSLSEIQAFENVKLFDLPILGPILENLQFSKFEDLPLIGSFFSEYPDPLIVLNNQTPAIYIGLLLLPLGHFLLFRSTIGLRIRAIGEHPQAAATAGINVHKYQYFAVILSGMFTGFAGGIIAFELDLFFAEMTLGLGFYALAIMIFGKWTVIGSVGAALFFGFFRTMSIKIAVAQNLAPNTPPPVINAIPNIIALIALAGFIGRAKPPASIGIPYDPNEGE